MDMKIDQQVALDEALVPHARRLRIERRNFRLLSDAFLVTADVPEIYMQELWATATVYHHSIRFKMDNKKHIVNLESFREMLHICPRLPGQTFNEPPFKEEIMTFLRSLGHSGEIRRLTDVEHKDTKKSNEMYYPRFTKVIIQHFMSKDPSIPRRNKVNWHYVRDDQMFTKIKLVSRHQNTQQFGAMLPIKLTNADIRNSDAYKEYYAVATGATPPKTKASVRLTKSSSDTTVTLPPTAAAGTRLFTYAKGKQPATTSKAKSLTGLSEVAMTEAQQLKLATKRSLQQTHISQASGSGADEETSTIPGVPDVPTEESDEGISWKSSNEGDDEDDDEKGDDGIKREFSNARTPQQNGVAEMRNRTLIETARTILADAKLPFTFWPEAVNTACYVQNRVLVNKSHNKTLYELFNAFRVFNNRTRRIEENLHVEFLENKAIVQGAGPNWLFDIESLTKSMNYIPVDVGTNSTNLSGTKEAANQEVKKNESSQRYILLPNWAHDALLESTSSKLYEESSPLVPTACLEETPSLDNILSLTNMFDDILRVSTSSDEIIGVEADVSNMETSISASPTPTLRIHKDHPKRQDEEDEEDELYRDVNINLGKGVQMADVHTTQEFEYSHVTLTPVNPDGQQHSSSMSSQFVTSMLNPTPDAGIKSIFETSSQMDVQPQTIVAPLPLSEPTLTPLTIATSDRLRDEAQAENEEFLKTIDENIQKIIKEQVKEQVKVQVSKILPKIEQTVNEQLETEVVTRSSNSSKTSYAVTADLSEIELKKILIEKMEGNKSIHRSNEQRNLYKALIEAYKSDKIILDTYGDAVTLKRRRDNDADKDEEPSAGSDRGSKRRREGKEPESASAPKERATRSASKSTQGSKYRQTSTSKSVTAEEPMHTTHEMEEPLYL
uniref:Uncharacterized protein n=1 Tax=Tanacetum cinerariifolium TaxID=118510 RepID=A0A6L2NYR1_TANCI|nr:hypothetical protein [Tanacetum cinerariifolium]